MTDRNKTNIRIGKLLMRLIAVWAMVMTVGLGVSAAKNDSQFTLVIDAGHGGHDHGAIDNGAREKDINLGVATKLASLIKKKMKDVNVVMTRDDDTFISLQERANIANRNKGNLFISIHTNSVDKSNSNRTKVAGTSVYALGPQKDANNLKVAQRENSVIELEDNYHQKYSGFDPSKDESYIIFELSQKTNLAQSLKFAEKAQKELVATAGRNDRGVKQAGFWVLWATSMPAVLVELDFICNPDEAKFLSSEEGQQKLAEALFKALQSYRNKDNNKVAEVKTSKNIDIKSVQESNPQAQISKTEEKEVTLKAQSNDRVETKKTHLAAKKQSNNAARKRRSASSKVLSDEKNFETESIILSDETRYLADRSEESAEQAPAIAMSMTQDNKESNKASSKKKQKKESSGKTKSNSIDNKKTTVESANMIAQTKTSDAKHNSPSKRNQKTFVVSNLPDDKKSSKNTVQSPGGTSGRSELVYKILLLTSEKELALNDPQFGRFKPTGVYMENNKYKYTIGDSHSRADIERKLLEIKTYVPEAEIVVRPN